MTITYSKVGSLPIREPLFQINRVKFRSTRESLIENKETNVLKIDITRIINELNQIDSKGIEKVEYFYPSIYEYTQEKKLEDGISSELQNINIYIDDAPPVQQANIDSIDKLKGKLSRLFYKLTLLENGN